MGISAAMIVRDSERCIARAIASILEAVDEIVVVDTGSTDNTVSIVKELSMKYNHIKLYYFKWIDDFAAARNHALSLVSHKWVFALDADEVLPEEHRDKLRQYTEWMERQGKQAGIYVVCDNTHQGEIVNTVETGILRIFPAFLRYADSIHETVRTDGMEIMQSDIHILHDGYDSSVVDIREKKRRNFSMIEKSLKKNPKNAHLWMQLGREMMDFDQEKANRYLDIAASLTTAPDLLRWIEKSRKASNVI